MRSVFLVLGVLLASCSKSSSSAAPEAGPPAPVPAADRITHPCALLQRGDVEAILGTSDLRQEEQPGSPGDAVCAWTPSAGAGRVELRIHVPSRKDDFDRRYIERKPVPGLGDRAYIQEKTTWGHVDVLRGDQTFFVQVEHGKLAGESVEKTHAEAIAVARAIVAKM